jgi:hypothetical protein
LKIDEPFIVAKTGPKCKNNQVIYVDYEGITEGSSFLDINVCLEASGPFQINWYLNGNKLNIDEASLTEGEKYTHSCTQYEIFKYHCFLSIENYNNKDVGEYLFKANLKDHPESILELTANVIKPSELYFSFKYNSLFQ